jgi:transcription antitermination factor NusG
VLMTGKRRGNPPLRFPERPIDQAEEKWWLVKVKPRQEKSLAFDLIAKNIEYYLPMYTKVTYRRGTNKRRKAVLPLFPGYICVAQKVPNDLYSTGRVARVIEVKVQEKFVRELTQVDCALRNGYTIAPVEERFMEEQEVEVVNGTLKGVKGIIVSVKKDRKLILTVDGLGRAAVEIDMAMVRSVKKTVGNQ